jgi:hypothetical protein
LEDGKKFWKTGFEENDKHNTLSEAAKAKAFVAARSTCKVIRILPVFASDMGVAKGSARRTHLC